MYCTTWPNTIGNFSLLRMAAFSEFQWLEFPGPFLWPALHHHFGLRKELHRMTSLTVKITEKTLPRAAERKEGHRRSDADINAHITHISLVAELSRAGAVTREQARHVAVGAAVHEGDRFINRLHVNQTQHRSENFRADDL